MVTNLPTTEGATENKENIFLRGLKELSWTKEPVVYEFTTDPSLLHQYYKLRERMYRKFFNTEEFDGSEDVYDKVSHILIARQGKLCLGGCRLTIREPHEDFLMPMEVDGFKLKHALPKLTLDHCRHGEVSRFAVMEGEKEREVMFSLATIIGEKAMQQDLEYMFVKSTYPMARNWRLIGNRVANIDAVIHNELNIPENPIHPDVKWYLTSFGYKEQIANAKEVVSKEKIKPLVH